MGKIGKQISLAKKLLESGELVAIPTETVYGLAANALDEKAVVKIFTTKARPHFDPLIVHVHSIEQAREYTLTFPEKAKKLADLFWPGPLTLVMKKKLSIPDIVTSGLDTVGIRCPAHPLTLDLLRQLPFPLAAPSANPFGYISPTTADHVDAQLGEHIPYILDGGPCRVGVESTIVGFENNVPIIYRQGGIAQEAIENMIGEVKNLYTSTKLLSPGQLESHYAPSKPFFLGNIAMMQQLPENSKAGILRFRGVATFPNEIILSETGDLEEAARNLFGALRQLDLMEVTTILAEEVPDQGLGKAINDRLRRAATQKPGNGNKKVLDYGHTT